MAKKKIAFILGIRPDVIRSAIILEKLRKQPGFELIFIWSGQHYSDNLKDIFFRELNVEPPQIELKADGENDAELSASVIRKLYPVLEEIKPMAAIFLGDTNTVMGCVAAAQLNIPIVHIEGCMRSYDWRMPEEKYRTVTDHLSDVIYAYLPEYKQQGVSEGLNPENIVVTTNPIVDILNRYYFTQKPKFDSLTSQSFFSKRKIEKDEYYLMTCHRRENVSSLEALRNILGLISSTERKIYFPASYRTQKVLSESSLTLAPNVIMVDPVGYTEMLSLLTNSRGVVTDSGTVIEEACILNIPSIQLRKSTERPQVYDVGASIKFDPDKAEKGDFKKTFAKLDALHGKTFPNPFGDGHASERIVSDILKRVADGTFDRHNPRSYHLDISHSFRNDNF
ncbi:MAG: UDP-N-acetylglucosamine 2-epimerase (non-hydrolyzing) [Candidatus Omnitrophota bacterium]|jgi:UDP-N-acetylglucosamine 2-epimerase (non-hydrolysing)